jgi:DNA-binding response OmpR family regulator
LDCEKFIISEVEKLQPDLPILFCTTKPDKSLIDGMRASDAYIKKPTTVIDVVNQIKAILSAKKANN